MKHFSSGDKPPEYDSPPIGGFKDDKVYGEPIILDSNILYYYILGNCIYECRYEGDWFKLTNGEVESTKSEEHLIELNAIKIYYK